MKIEKSNNPVAVGALALVLVLIVGRILWMVFGQGAPVAAASKLPAAAGSPAPNAVLMPNASAVPGPRTTPVAAARPAPETDADTSVVPPVTTRNPFSAVVRPARTLPPAFGGPQADRTRRIATGTQAMSLMPLPPLPVRIWPSRLRAGGMQPPTAQGLTVLPSNQTAAKGQSESVPALKLTATIGGTERLAVVQTTRAEPFVLHVGDTIDGMRVAAIHEQDVLFARGNGFWTLPLQSATGDSAPDSLSVTSEQAASQSEISVTTPKETINESP